jgi:hypothetical protein
MQNKFHHRGHGEEKKLNRKVTKATKKDSYWSYRKRNTVKLGRAFL